MTDALAINLDAPCWLWTGRLGRLGYARTSFGGVGHMVHRYVWTLMRGPIPDGLEIDHLCRLRHCLNPQHMELVTHRENTLRGDTLPAANVRKTHCPQGHPYDHANTYVNAKGQRWCRSCHAAHSRARRIRQRKSGGTT